MPYFSIVLPCFNSQATIQASLDGLAAQSFGDWEAICIDDGSDDQTRSMIYERAAQDPRIIPVSNPGKGPSAARNYAATEVATGDVIAFCDADDIWCPQKLAEIHREMNRGDIDGAFGQIAFFNETPDDSRVRSTVPRHDLTVAVLLGENPVCTMSNLAVRRRIFLLSGGLDETLVHNEDLEFLVRLVGHGSRIRGINSLQVWYRTNTDGLSSDLKAMRDGRDGALKTAQMLGYSPDRKSEAVHLRYLARRSLRLDATPLAALRFTFAGILQSPFSFLLPVHRGVPTAIACCMAPLIPRPIRRKLFA
jgi:glycosyltransferase involved in cell wall biosynthesis